MKRMLLLFLLCALLPVCSACRVRTGLEANPSGAPDPGRAGQGHSTSTDDFLPESPREVSPFSAESEEVTEDFSTETKENPQAARKEYDDQANVEFLPDAERRLAEEGEGPDASLPSSDESRRASLLNEDAGKTALQKLPAEEADRMGISEEAEEADSAFRYYAVLLQEGLSSLFECKRMNVYWETDADHITVYRTSAEHQLILESGCYDVSSRLTEERLRIDDGRVFRKNPDIIVKAVDSSVLGRSVHSPAAAQALRSALLGRAEWSAIQAVRSGRVILLSSEVLESSWLRLMAQLTLAKAAYPEVFGDLDLARAQQMLSEEATGLISDALYFDLGE